MIVMSLGGSLINPKEVDVAFLKKFRKFVLDSKERFIVVCGGGYLARKYMNAARKVSDRNPDWFGIQATWMHANLLWSLFELPPRAVFMKPEKVRFSKIICAAGWKPGVSTDYDAVLWAELYNVDTVYNLTNVDYVYDRDPKREGAEPFPRLSWKEYDKLIGPWKSGLHAPFDPVAAKRAEKSRIRVVTLDGRKLNNLRKALAQQKFVGTVIE